VAAKKPSAREIFKGRIRPLRALGYEIDKRGRVRKNGKPIKAATVQRAAAKIDRAKVQGAQKQKRALGRTKLLTGLERTTSKTQRKEFTVKDAAKWTGQSQRTVQKWIDVGGTPPEALDCIRAKLSGEKCLPIEWKHGKTSKATNDERKELQRKLRMFVQGKRKRATDTKKRYDEWYKAKKTLRKKLTKKAWREVMIKVGHAEGLDDEGTFSIMRFMLS
jgi:hypothetical protein